MSPTAVPRARIAVIGAGASAVCLLDALSRADDIPEEVIVFEPAPFLWRGRAYQPDAETMRVNAPLDDMSVRAGDPAHLENWVEARRLIVGVGPGHADPWSGVRFLSRPAYGDYLEQSARAALRRLAARGCVIEVVREPVTGVCRTADGHEVRTAHDTRRTVRDVVLCVGGGRPVDSYGLTGTPGFVPDPYPVRQTLDGIAPDAPVAVLGSGLTGVDVVLALAARGHRGPITMLSRSGVLPAVRQRPMPLRLRHFTAGHFRGMAARGERLTLDGAVSLMRAELADAGADAGGVSREIAAVYAEPPLDRLRRHLAMVDDPGTGLRILQRAVPETGPDVWPLLSPVEQGLVLRRHYRTILSLCCPMPPASAARLLGLVGEGRLTLHAGLTGVRATGTGFTWSAGEATGTAAVVVNAVNPPPDRIAGRAGALVTGLVESGLARRHHRAGLCVDRATSGVVVGDRTDRHLFVLGDLAAGSLFFTFGVPSLVDRAQDIALALCRPADRRVPVPSIERNTL